MVATPATTIALITGAGRATGLGFEAARQLGQKGILVLLTARNAKAADELAAQLKSEGLDVVGHELDVTRSDSVQALCDAIECDYGRLDILINNAASALPMRELAASADLDVAHDMMETVLFGSWRLTQA
jgi:NAD(P)-dependent dehydrogenase (short-subunit alcohol dehydrogenase family)